jgi:hypothetical protein
LTPIMEMVADLLQHRQRTPHWLEEDFRTAAIEFGMEALNRAQFIALMEKTCLEYQQVEKSVALTNEICAAYDGANVCGE